MKKFKYIKLYSILSLLAFFTISCGTVSNNNDYTIEDENNLNSSTEEYVLGEDRLTWGIHWYGYDDNHQEFIKGEDNPYYDPSKPVVIYVHGWFKDKTINNYELDTLYIEEVDVYTQNFWLDRGYNVGLFHWNQFADDELSNAEAKIWSPAGPAGMRYRLDDGSYSTVHSPDKSVGQLFYDNFIDALEDHYGSEIRIVGHSLGSQLTGNLAGIVHDNIMAGNISSHYEIDRIALIDPAFSSYGKDYLGDLNGDGNLDWVGERVRWNIQKTINDIDSAVEIYNSTPLDWGLVVMDNNIPLQEMACDVSLRPWYYNAFQLVEKHVIAPRHYFWSIEFDTPTECTINWLNQRIPTGNIGPSASTPTWRIKEMMGNTYKWDQVEGRYTFTPEDDWFERKYY